jgi:catechol 2,3-dioxygenase-like lactoylglutathione lyase family enzyme
MRLRSACPFFLVRDLQATLAWYRDILGFSVYGTWGEPPHFGIVGGDDVQLMVRQCADPPVPNRTADEDGLDAYIYVDEVDAFHAAVKARGGAFLLDPTDRFYKNREVEIADPDGHVLCFAQSLSD